MLDSILRWLKIQLPLSLQAAPRSRQIPARPELEPLECRMAPAIFNVNSLADTLTPPPGSVTLRSAIQLANATPGGNTINLTVPGTYQITLAGANDDNNATGDFDILPTGGNLSIVNTSGGAVIVDGGLLDRVFDVNPGAVAAKFTVTMQGFTIQHGNPPAGATLFGSGGAIRSQGSASLTLINMTVTGNTAFTTGGGIAVQIAVASKPWTVTLTNTTLSDNRAGTAGGGIYTDGAGTVNLNAGTTISDNTSLIQGGGAWLDAVSGQSADLNASSLLVSNNKAINGPGGGIGSGGNGTVTITSSTFQSNYSSLDGGAFAHEANVGSLNVSNSLFQNNTALQNGGAIIESNSATINASEFSNNSSGSGGGAIWCGFNLSLSGSAVLNNTASGSGGGVAFDSLGSGSIANCTFFGNSASGNGGAIDKELTGTLALVNDTINGNFAGAGGGLYWPGAGTLSVLNTIIAGNTAGSGPDVSANQFYTATLNAAGEVPPGTSPGRGSASIVLDTTQTKVGVAFQSVGLLGAITAQQIQDSPVGTNGPIAQDASGNKITLGSASVTSGYFTVDNLITHNIGGFVSQLFAGNIYANIVTTTSPAGEIRGQFALLPGTFLDLGGNLIGIAGVAGGNTVFNASSTQTGTVANPLNPRLGALQNNGGPTVGAPASALTLPSEAVLPGSIAIDSGVSTGAPLIDGRGFLRPDGAVQKPDSGAYEFQHVSLAVTVSPAMAYVAINNSETVTITVTNLGTGTLPADGSTLTLNLSNGLSAIPGSPLTFSVGVLAAGAHASFTVQVAATAFGTQLVNASVASVDSEQASTSTSGGILVLNPQERFVESLYHIDLHRHGSLAELDGWVGVLTGPGGTQAGVATSIAGSLEARDDLVQSWYAAYLGRPASGGEELGWVSLLANHTQEQVLSQIVGSSEFYNRAQTLSASGTPDQRFVKALFQQLLQRPADATEAAGWASALPTLGTQGVALSIIQSEEYRALQVSNYFHELLHRAADASEVQGWSLTALDLGTIRIGIESSSEFFANG